ncbi:MAG: hypothetical protein WCJ84_05815 [Candidatus Peregrinibacteria bacterium]
MKHALDGLQDAIDICQQYEKVCKEDVHQSVIFTDFGERIMDLRLELERLLSEIVKTYHNKSLSCNERDYFETKAKESLI